MSKGIPGVKQGTHEYCRCCGDVRPTPIKQLFSIDKDLVEWLELYCEEVGIAKSRVINKLLFDFKIALDKNVEGDCEDE